MVGGREFVADSAEFARVGDVDYVHGAAAGDAAVVVGNVFLGEVGDEDVGEGTELFLGGFAAGDFDGGAVPVFGEGGMVLVASSSCFSCHGRVCCGDLAVV